MYSYDYRMAAELYPCSRCNGTGKLPHHSNVLSGVCFKCGGSGKQQGKPVSKKKMWLVSFVNKETGKRDVIYREGGSYSERAVRKIVESRSSAPIFDRYDLTTMVIERAP